MTDWLSNVRIHPEDERLITPFQDTIKYLHKDTEPVRHAVASLDRVEECLAALDASLPVAISELVTDIVFVESTVPDEGGIFSFSDEAAPDVLYVAPYAGGLPVAPEDIADSIYHEFLHQLLYHDEEAGPYLFERNYPRFPAPWRPGMRPAVGFLHGTFVFTWLSRYWSSVGSVSWVDSDKAASNARLFRDQAAYGIRTLRDFALLTARGEDLVRELADTLGGVEASLPPGVLQEA